MDDLLDFTVTSDAIGKPANADLKLGLATAPVLYAAEEYVQLWILIERKFNQPGDAELVRHITMTHNLDFWLSSNV